VLDPCRCGQPLVCFICEACALCCSAEGGPLACWEAHEAWREGRGDAVVGSIATQRPPVGVAPAPRPRMWLA
jgi:hypothetical protein